MTGIEFVIEGARAEDLPACAELSCSRSGGNVDDRATALARWLSDSSRCLFVARHDGAVVGYGKADYFVPASDASPAVAPEGYYLGGVEVAEGMRRRGMGTALTQVRMTWAAERATEIWYFTNARNRGSLELHAKLGFVEVTRSFEYPGVSFDGGVGVLCRATL